MTANQLSTVPERLGGPHRCVSGRAGGPSRSPCCIGRDMPSIQLRAGSTRALYVEGVNWLLVVTLLLVTVGAYLGIGVLTAIG